MSTPILFPYVHVYFAGIIELDNNVYEPCFLIKQRLDPIELEIQFHAWYKTRQEPITNYDKARKQALTMPEHKHMFHGWKFNESSLREFDMFERFNRTTEIFVELSDRINWILKGVEMNADNLIGWQFDREYTKMMVEKYKTVPPPQIGDKPVKKRKKK